MLASLTDLARAAAIVAMVASTNGCSSLACSGCQQYHAFSFRDAAGDIVMTSYRIDAVPDPTIQR
jgi:hypothetical protein